MDAQEEELVALLLKQARDGDEAVASIARVLKLCDHFKARWTMPGDPLVPVQAILSALTGEPRG